MRIVNKMQMARKKNQRRRHVLHNNTMNIDRNAYAESTRKETTVFVVENFENSRLGKRKKCGFALGYVGLGLTDNDNDEIR